ncbi:hypothetical protein K7432_003116 [Basidiobolus ranarum]|uniref:BZIP domain-containing protein n=1 Tax=Basidiobolus ranarum TaxID=34480 RepID=A0ABR2X0D6_9FUNG
MSETVSRLGLPRTDFSEADIGAPTPTRFLLECGEYKLTPSISALGEINPFEASFNSTGGKKEVLFSTPNTNSKNASVPNATLAPIPPPPSSNITLVPTSVPEIASLPKTESNQYTKATTTAQPFNKTSQNSAPPKSSEPVSEALNTTTSRANENMHDQYSSSDDSQNDKYDKSSGYKRKSSSNGDNDEDKRRRFLERNRVAASKCRQKKKMWVKELEYKSDEISARNKQLQQLVGQLKEELLHLKSQLLGHRNCNCNVIQQYVQTSGHFGPLPLDANGSAVMGAGVPMQIPQANLPPQQTFSNMSSVVGLPPFVNN